MQYTYHVYDEIGSIPTFNNATGDFVATIYYTRVLWIDGFKLVIGSEYKECFNRIVEVSTGLDAVHIYDRLNVPEKTLLEELDRKIVAAKAPFPNIVAFATNKQLNNLDKLSLCAMSNIIF